jgi:integrase/recombinase XerD
MKTIDDLIGEYIEYIRSLRFSEETIRKQRGALRRFSTWLKEKFQVETIDRLRSDHVKRWHGSLSGLRTNEGYPLKSTSLNRTITIVRGFINYLAQGGYVPVKFLNALLYLKEPQQLPGSVLTHAQVKQLLTHIATDSQEGYRNRAMFELLYTSGIRAGELLGLDVESIDVKNKTALINGKGDKQRVVPIGKTALKYLESYIIAIRPYLMQDEAEKALFLGREGRRLPYHIFRRIVVSAADRAGLNEHVTAHTFRRSCTTELIRGGANIYHVKELLGHESLDTLKHYTKLTITDLKKTHEKYHPREKDGD